jgi:integrase
MASIKEKVSGGTLISCKFTAFLGRDETGKRAFKCKTWQPPEGLTLAKARKAAEIAAALFEQEVREETETAAQPKTTPINAMAAYPFDKFVKDVWIPLHLQDGTHRPKTICFYNGLLRIILPYFEGKPLDGITGIAITEYLSWLRTEYKSARGKPLADKTIKHHYGALFLIFNYAVRQDILTKNPMDKVDAPRVSRKPVDALSPTETAAFFTALSTRPLDFRCMLHVLITTGLRRGECLGLQWRDIDQDGGTLNVKRSVNYTVESGVNVAEPKTPKSIRTIPVISSTLSMLNEWRRETETAHPKKNLECAFVFASPDSPFSPYNAGAFYRRISRFMKANNLPDISAHDLRHTCASLLLSSGADIKSVQEILGHADASTTLNFYVKSDMRQMRAATDKFAAAFGL